MKSFLSTGVMLLVSATTVLFPAERYTHFLPGMDDTIRHAHPAFRERVEERNRMVREDIENYPYLPVKDPDVLAAMRTVPRHLFVPQEYRHQAYANHPLLIGHNQTISQPFMVAYMTNVLDLKPGDRVLEIGTGSGYQAAVLAELCGQVYTIEIIPELADRAARLLKELGYEQVKVKTGNGYEGWPEQAPFDRIIVTCAPDAIPKPLIDQLNPGGKIVIPVGEPYQTQYLYVVSKNRKGNVVTDRQYPVRFVPMTGKPEQR